MNAKVVGITIYPVKSMRGIDLKSSLITPQGLKLDRRWMVVDEAGQFVSQRHVQKLAQINVRLEDENLVLTHENEKLVLPMSPDISDKTTFKKVSIWNDELHNIDGYFSSQKWFEAVLGTYNGQKLTLVKIPDQNIRRVEPEYLGDSDAFTGFADGYPILVANQASLDALNVQLTRDKAKNVEMDRFRPNIVLDGMPAFEEEVGGSLSHTTTGTELKLVKPCQRCQMITFSQRSGELEEVGQPTKSLLKVQNLTMPGAYFGQNAIVSSLGSLSTINIGDVLDWCPN